MYTSPNHVFMVREVPHVFVISGGLSGGAQTYQALVTYLVIRG